MGKKRTKSVTVAGAPRLEKFQVELGHEENIWEHRSWLGVGICSQRKRNRTKGNSSHARAGLGWILGKFLLEFLAQGEFWPGNDNEALTQNPFEAGPV